MTFKLGISVRNPYLTTVKITKYWRNRYIAIGNACLGVFTNMVNLIKAKNCETITHVKVPTELLFPAGKKQKEQSSEKFKAINTQIWQWRRTLQRRKQKPRTPCHSTMQILRTSLRNQSKMLVTQALTGSADFQDENKTNSCQLSAKTPAGHTWSWADVCGRMTGNSNILPQQRRKQTRSSKSSNALKTTHWDAKVRKNQLW